MITQRANLITGRAFLNVLCKFVITQRADFGFVVITQRAFLKVICKFEITGRASLKLFCKFVIIQRADFGVDDQGGPVEEWPETDVNLAPDVVFQDLKSAQGNQMCPHRSI